MGLGVTDYDVRARTTAGRLLNSKANGGKGQAITLTRQSTGTYNPATGTNAVTTSTQNCTGVVIEYDAKAIDGDLVRMGDKKLLLSPLNTAGTAITAPVPDESTVTLADASVWTVKNVDTLDPAGTAILYTLQIRGA